MPLYQLMASGDSETSAAYRNLKLLRSITGVEQFHYNPTTEELTFNNQIYWDPYTASLSGTEPSLVAPCSRDSLPGIKVIQHNLREFFSESPYCFFRFYLNDLDKMLHLCVRVPPSIITQMLGGWLGIETLKNDYLIDINGEDDSLECFTNRIDSIHLKDPERLIKEAQRVIRERDDIISRFQELGVPKGKIQITGDEQLSIQVEREVMESVLGGSLEAYLYGSAD